MPSNYLNVSMLLKKEKINYKHYFFINLSVISFPIFDHHDLRPLVCGSNIITINMGYGKKSVGPVNRSVAKRVREKSLKLQIVRSDMQKLYTVFFFFFVYSDYIISHLN